MAGAMNVESLTEWLRRQYEKETGLASLSVGKRPFAVFQMPQSSLTKATATKSQYGKHLHIAPETEITYDDKWLESLLSSCGKVDLRTVVDCIRHQHEDGFPG